MPHHFVLQSSQQNLNMIISSSAANVTFFPSVNQHKTDSEENPTDMEPHSQLRKLQTFTSAFHFVQRDGFCPFTHHPAPIVFGLYICPHSPTIALRSLLSHILALHLRSVPRRNVASGLLPAEPQCLTINLLSRHHSLATTPRHGAGQQLDARAAPRLAYSTFRAQPRLGRIG